MDLVTDCVQGQTASLGESGLRFRVGESLERLGDVVSRVGNLQTILVIPEGPYVVPRYQTV